MDLILTFFGNAARLIVEIYMLLLLARAILQFLPVDEDGALFDFIYTVTETVISPVRALLDRIAPTDALPVDISFILTYILLGLVDMILLIL